MPLANVTTNPCLMWPHYISYVINYVHNYYGPYADCSLDKGVAYTRRGGGGLQVRMPIQLIHSQQRKSLAQDEGTGPHRSEGGQLAG